MARFHLTAVTVALAIAVSAMTAAAARAAILTITYDGVVAPCNCGNTNIDVNGLFGAANANLTGDPFSAVFMLDTSNGERIASRIVGGSHWGVSTPGLSSLLTINGNSISLGNGAVSAQTGLTIHKVTEIIEQVDSVTGFVDTDSSIFLDALGAYILNFNGQNLHASGVLSSSGSFFLHGESAVFRIDDVTIDPFDAIARGVNGGSVPEPATWALALTGFGIAGAALRRRSIGAAA